MHEILFSLVSTDFSGLFFVFAECGTVLAFFGGGALLKLYVDFDRPDGTQ
jgi:hypothetical protein